MKNSKLKILYISTLYEVANSSAAIRNNSLVKGMRELGYAVDILTVKWPNDLISNYFVNERNYDNIFRTELNEIRLNSNIKGKIKNTNKFVSLLKQNLKKIFFFPDICKNWYNEINPREFDGYDILITSSDMKSAHFVGREFKKYFPDLPWMQIWGDPWESDVNTPKYLKGYVKKKEMKILSLADLIYYVSEPTKNEMVSKYPILKDKIKYLPRSYYNESRKTTTQSNYIKILYTGAISNNRNLAILAQILDNYNSAKNNSKIILEIVGTYSEEVKNELLKFDSIYLKGSYPFDKIIEEYANADLLLYVGNNAESSQIPGKLYDYFGSDRPILCLVNSKVDEIYKFLSSFDRCLVVPNNHEDIKYYLSDLINISNKHFDPVRIYSPINVAQMFVNDFNNLK